VIVWLSTVIISMTIAEITGVLPPITRVPPRPSDIGTVPIVVRELPGTTVNLLVAVGKCIVGGWRTTAKPVGLIVSAWPPIVTTSVAEDPVGSLRVLVPITRVPESPSEFRQYLPQMLLEGQCLSALCQRRSMFCQVQPETF
jgi:hypothetical protein